MTKNLTSRQREVLRHIAVGRLCKEAASELGISEHGVHVHLLRMREQLEVDSTTALIHYALKKGIVRNLFS